MKLTGELEIGAPGPRVWDVIVDPTGLAACVPGVGEVRQVDDATFEGTVRASIGPIDGDFTFTSRLTEAIYPRLIVDVEGTDSMTKSRITAHIDATIVEHGDGATILRYDATVLTKGRLAIIGDMVLRATAGMMIGQVAACVRSRVEAAPS